MVDDSMLVLASSSPRRIEMLRAIGLPHKVHPVPIDETPSPGEGPAQLVVRLSQAKAEAAAPFYPDHPVLGADTIVVAGGSILGKPAHEGAARQMLELLSGRTHEVWTGYYVRYKDATEIKSFCRVVTTKVCVKPLSEKERDAYVRSQEWRGKAGGYALQGKFAAFVREIFGNYDSVIGLPLCLLLEDLAKVGLLPQGFPAWNS